MLSGMKTLGGIAFSAARAGVNAAVEQGVAHARSASVSGTSTPGALGRLFSKSAPAAMGSPHKNQTTADRQHDYGYCTLKDMYQCPRYMYTTPAADPTSRYHPPACYCIGIPPAPDQAAHITHH